MKDNLKILVIDDEEDVYFLFKQHFKEEIKLDNIEFFFALSAEEALKILPSLQAHLILILSDINMPGMNGLELLKIIKHRYPDITVFMITAYGDPNNCQLAWEYGAAEILNKPINFAYLKNLILNFRRSHKPEGSEQ